MKKKEIINKIIDLSEYMPQHQEPEDDFWHLLNEIIKLKKDILYKK